MLTTRTRSTIVALIASAGFAATTVVPAVSQARPKTVTSKKVTAREACDAVADSMLNAEAEARNYEKKGETKNAEASWAAANLYFDVWSEQGCATVAVTGPSTSGLAAPVGGASATR